MPERERRGSGPTRRSSGGTAKSAGAGVPPRFEDRVELDAERPPSAAVCITTPLAEVVAEVSRLLVPGLARGDYTDTEREARDLVAALHDQPRFWASLHPAHPVPAAMRDRSHAAARRRAAGAPLAYAAGRASFRHLTLDVDERVLIPRPETEQLVEIVLALLGREPGGTVADVGTGSGAIALALASEGRFDRVIASDLSRDALEVAEGNRAKLAAVLHATVELRHGTLLAPVPETGLRAVVSNPPYIALHEAPSLPRAVRDWEPSLALYSAGEGMALTRDLVRQAADRLAPGGVLALEVDARRAALVEEVVGADARYGQVRVTLDLFGRERFVTAVRR